MSFGAPGYANYVRMVPIESREWLLRFDVTYHTTPHHPTDKTHPAFDKTVPMYVKNSKHPSVTSRYIGVH